VMKIASNDEDGLNWCDDIDNFTSFFTDYRLF